MTTATQPGTETVNATWKAWIWSQITSRFQTGNRETGGRICAYIGTLVGGGLSIWANVEHAYLPPKGFPEDWSPPVLDVVFAVFWPVCALIVLEVLARAVVLKGWRYVPLRYAALGLIGLVAGTVSYVDISDLLKSYGSQKIVYTIGPIAVDGLMILCAAVVYLTGRAAQTPVPVETVRRSRASRTVTPHPVMPVSTQTMDRIQARMVRSETAETESQSPRPIQTGAVRRVNRSPVQAERLQLIKDTEPDWMNQLGKGGRLSKARIGEIIGLPNASGTQQELRNELKKEAGLVSPEDNTAETRELVSVG